MTPIHHLLIFLFRNPGIHSTTFPADHQAKSAGFLLQGQPLGRVTLDASCAFGSRASAKETHIAVAPKPDASKRALVKGDL